MKLHYTALLFCLLLISCQRPEPVSGPLKDIASNAPAIEGREEYLRSPYVTAGDRLYMIGHQDGQFPDLGWHVAGEMGGIWDHPIKLMDGFAATLVQDGQTHCLQAAERFVNYPFANKHIYGDTPTGISVERFQFVPDGQEAVVVEYTFVNESEKAQQFSFVFNAMVDLRPVWLGERTGMEDGGDYAWWEETAQALAAKDSLNDWYVLWGAVTAPEAHDIGSQACDFERLGKGVNAALTYTLALPPGGTATLPIVIAGSYTSLEAARETLQAVQQNARQMLEDKKERYAAIAQVAKLSIPDSSLQQALEWVKYNTDWLIRDVPEQGRGLSAGLPDYPWWFGCDNTYALQGVLASGRTDIAFSTLELLQQLSEKTNGNGRIIHEVSTNGAVFNPGNINETPHFASMVWTAYQWTGDRPFLEKMYPVVKKGLAWLLEDNDADGNLCPDGFGMMEIHGLNSEMIDVAVYTQKAFADAALMATEMADAEQATAYQQVADRLRERINTDFWVPEFNSYADFIGTTRQAMHLIGDAIVRADTLGKPWAVEELKATRARIEGYPPDQKRGFVLYHNWVVNTPMETGVAAPEKALAALQTGSRFSSPFGLFVTGIDRDESAGNDEGSFAAGKKTFSYVGAVMTLPTGVQAIAENNYGRPDEALGYLQRLVRSFSFALPGSMYEVSPDFGMMTQAWTVYSLYVPVARQFFGVTPHAPQRKVQISPQMPSGWEQAALENLIVGANQLSIHYNRQGDVVKLSVGQSKGDWQLVLSFPRGQYRSWKLNGLETTPEAVGRYDQVVANGEQVVLEVAK
ncbi:MAG: hypothetical protein KDC66_16800 [Phaeodactylibacter sp.]|nr:hypothetical protein [Phaeodactylibacter sp.]